MRAVIFLLMWLVVRVWAQESDAYKFAPPPPPPPIDDYEEMDDEGFDGEDSFRPPPPPLPPQTGSGGGPPMPALPPPDSRPTSESYISQPGKFRFKILDGEFWEKGKKRGRGKQFRGRSAGG